MIVLYLQSLLKGVNSINEPIILQMLIDLLNIGFNKTVASCLFLHPLHNIINLFMLTTGGIILPIDRLLKFQWFLVGSMRSMGW